MKCWQLQVRLFLTIIGVGVGPFGLGTLCGCSSRSADPAVVAQAEQELQQLREANQELQRLRAENQELPRLRRDNEELKRLRAQSDQVASLRQEQEQLRSQLQALKPVPRPRP